MNARLPIAVVFMLLAACPMIRAADDGETSLVPPVLLPDGREFKTWEKPVVWSRTLYVDQGNPRASDDNPGTQDRPLRTINHAARLLQPGERAVIAAGVYRERVRPTRGGTGPERMIGYEAAPGAPVVLSGSRVLTARWAPSSRRVSRLDGKLWMARLPKELFPDENPFKEVNLTDEQIDRSMDWAVPIKGKAPNTLRRGLVFQGGKRLVQVAVASQLGFAAGSYRVEEKGAEPVLHLRPFDDADPNRATIEVTVQGEIFAPEAFGLGYIRLKGLTVEHAGNCFPRPQEGAISTRRGHHWIIEDCTVRQCNSIGIDIGDQFATEGPKLAEGGRHTVRRNAISDCGIGGIEGPWIEDTLIEDNVIRRCGWQDVWPLYECGGIKVHCTRSCLLRRNLVTGTIGAPGIWTDWDNVNSRLSGNVIVDCQCETGGLFVEASQKPNLVDNNIVWATRGNGIYQHDCDELVIAHNLVVKSSDTPVRMQICQGREVMGRLSTARRNKIVNNLFVDHARPPAISDPDNMCDYNVYASSGSPFDLAAWQKVGGWDSHSAAVRLAIQFEPQTLQSAWPADAAIPSFPAVPRVARDFFGRPRFALTLPGPFATLPPPKLLPSVRE